MGHVVVTAGMQLEKLVPSAIVKAQTPEKRCWICLNCGAWSQGRAVKLAKPCLRPDEKPTKKGQEVLRRFYQGKPPNRRVRAFLGRSIALPSLASSVESAPSESPPDVMVVPVVFSASREVPTHEQTGGAVNAVAEYTTTPSARTPQS